MKKFITKEELTSVIADLVNKYEGNNRYSLSLDIRVNVYGIDLRVQALDTNNDYATAFRAEYAVIEEPLDSYDVEKEMAESLKASELRLQEEQDDSVEIECA